VQTAQFQVAVLDSDPYACAAALIASLAHQLTSTNHTRRVKDMTSALEILSAVTLMFPAHRLVIFRSSAHLHAFATTFFGEL
jgi:hypothetical protein